MSQWDKKRGSHFFISWSAQTPKATFLSKNKMRDDEYKPYILHALAHDHCPNLRISHFVSVR